MQAACGNRSRDDLRYVVVLATALAGLSLGGCTEKPDNRELSAKLAPMPEPEQPSVMEPTPEPAVSAVRAPNVSARKITKKKPRLYARLDAGTLPRFDPGTLMGLEPPAVDRMLGRPAGTYTDATAVEWIYSRPGCSLNIFFYPDIATGSLRALKYNVTNRRAGDNRSCINVPIVARSDGSG
ncbi:MAG TPA: hypothetical protein VGH23_16800 [Rhizomicrobium sp.]|jgi:hypothetical protein